MKNSKQCTSLQDMEEDCLPTSSLDTNQLSLLSGTNTPAKYLESEPQTGGSQDCKCGKAMSECSIHPNTPGKWTASMQDFLAKTLAEPVLKRALDMRHGLDSTEKFSASLAWFDPKDSILKTCQQSLLMDSEPFLGTLPRWGSMRNGVVSEHPISGLGMTGTDGFLLPTLTVHGNYNKKGASKNSGDGLATALKKMPTLCARDWKDNGTSPAELRRNTPPLAVMAGGPLNPKWCEWFMGFPIGFTELKVSETRKSQSKQQQHGNFLQENK